MKTIIKIYENGKLLKSKIYKTKKEAQQFKKSYLTKFTIGQKVKNNIQVTIS